VPILIDIAQDLRFVVAGRSVALRALGKLALPQMQLLAAPLVEKVARRAYTVLAIYQALTKNGTIEPDEAGHAVLVRRCREYSAGMLELILETLAVAGFLPNFEALVVALRSSEGKDRGYAIETVEQACPRGTFVILLPLLDGRPIAAQVAFAREQGLVQERDAHTVLVETLETGFPMACAAAAQALLATSGEDGRERALTRLAQHPEPVLSETIVTFLGRRGAPASATGPLTPIEIARAFVAAPEFSSFLYAHFEFLVPQVRQLTLPAGTVLCARGAHLPGVWLIRAGTVRAGTAALGPGAVAGASVLLGVPAAPDTLTAETEGTTLFLSATALRRGGEIFPDLALALLAQKIAA
jgi:hypothetical protein